MKHVLIGIATAVLLIVAYLFLWPVSINPVEWQPKSGPKLEGTYAKNDLLKDIEWLAKDVAEGPEDVVLDKQGRIYGSFVDGKIRRFDNDGENAEVFADTGGRPLGMEWTPNGTLVVADADKGLLAVRSDGSIRTLAESADSVKFKFTNNVDVAKDNTIYFTDASHRFGYKHVVADILEHGGNGRLLQYDPVEDVATELLDGLQFANGVALGPNEEYLLVAETGAYRVIRYWLKGDKKGTHEVFLDNLPGLPDNINYDGDGIFWLAFYSPRNSMLEWSADKPWFRKMVHRIPSFLQPTKQELAFAIGVDESGEVVHNLQYDDDEAYAPVTSVRKVDGQLYFGSLTQPAIGRMEAP